MPAGFEQKTVHAVVQIQEGPRVTAGERSVLPSDAIFPSGNELTCYSKILDLDPEKERVSLSRKATLPKPWTVAEEKYPVGSIVEGKVVRIQPFGAFVELESGLDGLVPSYTWCSEVHSLPSSQHLPCASLRDAHLEFAGLS